MPLGKILAPLSGQYDLDGPNSLERPALEITFLLGRCLDAQESTARHKHGPSDQIVDGRIVA